MKEEYQDIFIENLKRLRTEKRLSQSELAKRCCVSSGTIGNIESKITKPSFDLIIAMSVVLGCSPRFFFETEEDLKKEHEEKEKSNNSINDEKQKKLDPKRIQDLKNYMSSAIDNFFSE